MEGRFYCSMGLWKLGVPGLLGAIELGWELQGGGNLQQDQREHGNENPEFGLKTFENLLYQQALFSGRD